MHRACCGLVYVCMYVGTYVRLCAVVGKHLHIHAPHSAQCAAGDPGPGGEARGAGRGAACVS